MLKFYLSGVQGRMVVGKSKQILVSNKEEKL